METFVVVNDNHWGQPVVRLRCPSCKHFGAFEPAALPNPHDWRFDHERGLAATMRKCPLPSCRALLFIVYDNSHEVVASFPPEVIDFDASELPASVVACLAETVQCNAQGCYRAAAIMLRRTLEEVCHDRGAEGANLKDRLSDLGAKASLTAPLIVGLTDLRLLGNDAAHIDAATYSDVGQAEVEVAIDVAKVILQAVYQYESTVRRLADLKASQQQTT
jgi:hypothetical protein